MSDIGHRIKKLRIQQKYSQNALAKRAGIAQATLNAIEAETKNPSVETVRMLAEALCCSVSELFGEESNDNALSGNERRLLVAARALNDAGIEELIRYAGLLSGNMIFTEKKAASSAV